MPDGTNKHKGLANLKPPWKPGESGNARGRPKGRSVAKILREILDMETIGDNEIQDGRQVADLVAETIVLGALGGNTTFMAMLLDRVEGKATTTSSEAPSVPELSETMRAALKEAYGVKDEPKSGE